MTYIEKILKAVGVEIQFDQPLFKARIPFALLGGMEYYLCDMSKDFNAIHELEQLVIQKFGVYEYGDKLIENTLGLFDYSSTQQAALFATADAKTRIAAMVAVIEEKK